MRSSARSLTEANPALSTAAGLLLVISSAISHDLLKKAIRPDISEKGELLAARIAAGVAVVFAGLLGIYPPGFVAQVVAFAFGLAAASFFPAIVLGIFDRRMNRQGAVAGMLTGLGFTIVMILLMRSDKLFGTEEPIIKDFMKISAEGIGIIGMFINAAVSLIISRITPPPPDEIQQLVEDIRVPSGAGEAVRH